MSFLEPTPADRRRRALIFGGVAVAITGFIVYAFMIDNENGYMKHDSKLIYAESWPADRSRDDAIADQLATQKVREQKLAESRAYIATLSGEAKKKAQDQYDAYIAGGGFKRDVPYVAAEPPVM